MHNERWLALAAGVVTLLYSFPLWIGALALAFGELNGGTTLGQVFLGAITGHATDPLQLLQRLLLPIVAGGTVLQFWSHAKGRAAKYLIGFTLAALVLAVVLWAYLDVEGPGLDLWQPANDASIKSTEEFRVALASYISSMIEGLATYLLVLLGLSAR